MALYNCDKCKRTQNDTYYPCTETPRWLPVVSGLICEDCDTNLVKPDPLDLGEVTGLIGEE